MKIETKSRPGHLWRRQCWRGNPFVLLGFLLLSLVLVSCEVAPNSGGASSGVSTPGDNTVRVEPDTSPNARNMTIDPLLPPGGVDRPAKPGQLARTRNESGLPVLDPKGPNLEQLFSQPAANTDARIKRVENAVVEIRKDLDAALPAINRLMSIEGDIQELIGQLQTLLNEDGGSAQKIPALRPPAPPTPTDELIEDIKDQDAKAIEPLAPDQLNKPLPPPPKAMPKLSPVPVEEKPIKPLVPQGQMKLEPLTQPEPDAAPDKVSTDTKTDPDVEQAQEKDTGIAVAPLPRDEKEESVVVDEDKVAEVVKPVVAKIVPEKKIETKPAVKAAEKVETKTDSTIRTASVRLGEHGDKIRVVIESARPITIKQDLDNAEKILVIDVAGANVETGHQKISGNVLVSGMNLKGAPDKKSGQIALELKKDTSVRMTTVMPPQGDKKVYRAVIDLAR